MEALDPGEVQRGTELLLEHLERIREDNAEIGDTHDAFEVFCMNKYSIGDPAECMRTAGKGDLGIDFYSVRDATYHIAQCKIPEPGWLESHRAGVRKFGPKAVDDPRDALSFLLGNSKAHANDKVRYLYGLVQGDRQRPDFALTVFLIVFGRLDQRAQAAFDELKTQYVAPGIRLVLQQIDDIVDDFLVGATHQSEGIEITLRVEKLQTLRAGDYCYFLANAADIFHAFKKYGWRLFNLNLRYEMRNSSVNGAIVDSLKHLKTRKRFHHYNNGLIVVCRSYAVRDREEAVRITNAQIVNGLQTVKSIYNAVTTKEVELRELETDCKVQIKVVGNEDPDFVADVVQNTNNQNPMAPRNLKSNAREQRTLRTELASLQPRWFCQVKEGEWESLTQEGGRFFKAVVGYPQSEFRPEPTRKRGRVLDNQYAAKAWLAFIGYSDYAGDRTTHYFAKGDVYDLSFRSRPTADRWKDFAELVDFRAKRGENLEVRQATAAEYLLAYLLWEFVRHFVPSPREYRAEALDEGVKQGVIRKADGSFTSPPKEQEDFLAANDTYQTWRIMANMKEVLVESLTFVLSIRYGQLNEMVCKSLLSSFDAAGFIDTGDIREVANDARSSKDLQKEAVFSRSMCFLRFVAGQFWQDKQSQILSTSRVRTLLLRPDMVADLKKTILGINERRGLDRAWKPEGPTFVESLPDLP